MSSVKVKERNEVKCLDYVLSVQETPDQDKRVLVGLLSLHLKMVFMLKHHTCSYFSSSAWYICRM